jgi:hypothetical protein
MPQLERGDLVRFEYRADNHDRGVYEGHVTGIGTKRILIKSGGNEAHISNPEQILGIIEKNDPKVVHNLGEEFRFAGGLGQEPLASLDE